MKRLYVSLLLVILPTLLSCSPKDVHQGPVTVTAVGDLYVSDTFLKENGAELRAIKLDGDIVSANLEGVVTGTYSENDKDNFRLAMPPEAVSLIKEMGINHVSQANNHAMDFGGETYNNTRSFLEEGGILVSGLNDQGSVIQVDGKSIRIIAFSFSGSNNVNDLENTRKAIENLQEDIVVVTAHMGGGGQGRFSVPGRMEYYGTEKRGDIKAFAHTCIDAGADLVIGHGPHVLRRAELYKDKLILYSLGDLVFDYPAAIIDRDSFSVAVSINLEGNGNLHSAEVTSFSLKDGIPARDPENRGFKLLKYLTAADGENYGLFFKKNHISPDSDM